MGESESSVWLQSLPPCPDTPATVVSVHQKPAEGEGVQSSAESSEVQERHSVDCGLLCLESSWFVLVYFLHCDSATVAAQSEKNFNYLDDRSSLQPRLSLTELAIQNKQKQQ